MKLNSVPGCCSMAVIENNPSYAISKTCFKQELKSILSQNSLRGSGIRTLILITNQNFINRLGYRALGFKRAYSYKGYSNFKAHVMYLNFKTNLYDYITK